MRLLLFAALIFATWALLLASQPAVADYISAQPYLAFDAPAAGSAVSPFSKLEFQYFHLEDFEDGSLNTPGVSLLESGDPSGPSAAYRDSVDGDDGLIDGTATQTRSLFSNYSVESFTFTFSSWALGGLPTHAGIVWTDVGRNGGGEPLPADLVDNVVFEAFGPTGESLGIIGPFSLGDASISRTTDEDRFLGIIHEPGISAIRLAMPGLTNWEADHLQYGRVAPELPVIGPLPYLSPADSPFPLNDPGFHLEDFEDGLLNTPGVSLQEDASTNVSPEARDSVDGDDGSIDGIGGQTLSLWSNFNSQSFTFIFSPGPLGGLPTHAGIVWTDVGRNGGGEPFPSDLVDNVVFEAYGPAGEYLGIAGPFSLGDTSIFGTTDEDRFLGIIHEPGISAIRLAMPGLTNWEADHLQYGRTAFAEICDDGLDNDVDGLVDYCDPDCVEQPSSSSSTITPTGFLLGRDGYCFANDQETTDHALKDLLEDTIAESLSWRSWYNTHVASYIWGSLVGNYAGYCWGMSATSAAYFTDWWVKPIQKDTSQYTREEAISGIRESAEKQALPLLASLLSIGSERNNESPRSVNQKEDYDTAQASIALGDPVVISLYGVRGHAVVGYETVDAGNQKYIMVYDPNCPGDRRNSVEFTVVSPEHYRLETYTNCHGFQANVSHAYKPWESLTTVDVKPALLNLGIELLTSLIERRLSRFVLGSPADALLTDQFGRRIGFVEGTYLNEIPGAEIVSKGEVEIFEVPAELEFDAEIVGNGDGKANIQIAQSGSSTTTIEFVGFSDVSVSDGSILSLAFGPYGVSTLSVDRDGDGVVEAIRQADIDEMLNPDQLRAEELDAEIAAKIQLKFNKPSRDRIQVKVENMALPAIVVPRNVTVDVGGAAFTGTLDAKGRYQSPDKRDSVVMKQSKKSQLWSITVKRKKNNFAAELADEGLTNADNPRPGLAVTVPLTIDVDGAIYSKDVDLRYNSKLGEKGNAN